ncbi:threonine aldolase family protein [Streptomyces lomondensis]|uniref:Threonine aldolase n=1 Tax=Streptomyces lomondensis TaxID=68229 RepID=A0ABQ2XEH8_9ACTN|nr:beta-eliminating lyase-related protein [Streptomyces lomondensis]MCF0077852.1 beta-eliminating lyase-related protein [Streptomyces lomondensis]GGX11958.1 threonine aldolase [Streptomyces lomondensis]
MTDTAERDEQAAGEDRGARIRERRLAAHRGARRVFARFGFHRTLRERLALLDGAGDAYDLDELSDVYGDGVVEALERKVAGLLGTEAAAFFPTGTMAQQVALRCWAGRTGDPTVALHALSHPEVHERNAFSEVAGLRPVRVTGEPRLPTAAEVRDFEEPFGALMLELPLRDAGFVLPSWEELTEVVEAARLRDAVVHFDGARLWESTVHLGRSLEEIAGLADSVYVSFYKSLEAFGGAALAGPRELVEEAKAWRHRYGGQVFQQFPTALSALVGLERELPRLPEYVAHARVVAAALREGFAATGLPWARVRPEVPHTHDFQVWLPYEADVLAEAAVRAAEETGVVLFGSGWDRGGPGLAFTDVHVRSDGLEWTAEDVKTAVAEFVARLPEQVR